MHAPFVFKLVFKVVVSFSQYAIVNKINLSEMNIILLTPCMLGI